jgi:CBS domain-containing protein
VDGWVAAVSELAHSGDDAESARVVAVLIDGRPVTPGDGASTAIAAALDDADARPGIERRLATLALRHRPPTGFAPGGVVEHDGRTTPLLDLERAGLVPIVDLGRVLAVRAGHRPVSTPARLDAARAGGLISADDAAALEAAFDLMLGLRLEHQATQARAGVPPDALLDPSTLDALARAFLREAFRAVARAQAALSEGLGAAQR